jgi:hypothetical protein
MICQNLNMMMMMMDETDGTMTTVSRGITNALKAGVHFPLRALGPTQLLSNACSIGHQFSHRGSEKHNDWLGTRMFH